MNNIKLKSFNRDKNGNSIIKFSILNNPKNKLSDITLNGRKINSDKDFYSYSVQTNGNLPLIHSARLAGKKAITLGDEHVNELREFLKMHGSDKQKFLVSQKLN